MTKVLFSDTKDLRNHQITAGTVTRYRIEAELGQAQKRSQLTVTSRATTDCLETSQTSLFGLLLSRDRDWDTEVVAIGQLEDEQLMEEEAVGD